jgi:N-acetylglucosamine kinase-like BadF-type ATPase
VIAARRYYLGIDGGQSGTTALIADQTGRIVGRGQSGPCNHVSPGESAAKFQSVVGECLRRACIEAALDPDDIAFAAACLGFSGGPEDKDPYARALIRSGKFKITNDAEIALSGATAGRPGIIIIAGTGSIAFGKNASGRTARAGGWGHIFGDEGGAFDLTRRALRAVLQFEEGWGPPTILLDKLLVATAAASANALLHLFYTPDYPRDRVASLAVLIDNAAKSGDAVAGTIIREAAASLANLVHGVHRNLFQSSQEVPIAYVGGVFRSSLILASLQAELRCNPGCHLVAPLYGPAAGAILEALQLDGITTPLSALSSLEK